MERIEHPLLPVYDERARILLLGTMPSPASRLAGFYYAHPQNRFWPVLAAVYQEPVPAGNAARAAFILEHRLALWDVLKSCTISGAADASIQSPVPNDIGALLCQTQITRVLCTGASAAALYTRLVPESARFPCLRLPSTSPANRRVSFGELVSAYSEALLPE